MVYLAACRKRITIRCTPAAKWGVLKWKISRRGGVIGIVLHTCQVCRMRTRLFAVLLLAFATSVAIGVYQSHYTASTTLSINVSFAAIMGVCIYCIATQRKDEFADLLKALLIWIPLPLASAEGIMESTMGYNEGIFRISHFKVAELPFLCCVANLLLLGSASLLTLTYLKRKDNAESTSLMAYVKISLVMQLAIGPVIYLSLANI